MLNKVINTSVHLQSFVTPQCYRRHIDIVLSFLKKKQKLTGGKNDPDLKIRVS